MAANWAIDHGRLSDGRVSLFDFLIRQVPLNLARRGKKSWRFVEEAKLERNEITYNDTRPTCLAAFTRSGGDTWN